MLRWLKVSAVGLVTSAVSLLLAFASGNVLLSLHLESQIAIWIALVIVVGGNLALYLLAFWGVTRALLGRFSARYWLVPGGVLLSLILFCVWIISTMRIYGQLPPDERRFPQRTLVQGCKALPAQPMMFAQEEPLDDHHDYRL